MTTEISSFNSVSNNDFMNLFTANQVCTNHLIEITTLLKLLVSSIYKIYDKKYNQVELNYQTNIYSNLYYEHQTNNSFKMDFMDFINKEFYKLAIRNTIDNPVVKYVVKNKNNLDAKLEKDFCPDSEVMVYLFTILIYEYKEKDEHRKFNNISKYLMDYFTSLNLVDEISFDIANVAALSNDKPAVVLAVKVDFTDNLQKLITKIQNHCVAITKEDNFRIPIAHFGIKLKNSNMIPHELLPTSLLHKYKRYIQTVINRHFKDLKKIPGCKVSNDFVASDNICPVFLEALIECDNILLLEVVEILHSATFFFMTHLQVRIPGSQFITDAIKLTLKTNEYTIYFKMDELYKIRCGIFTNATFLFNKIVTEECFARNFKKTDYNSVTSTKNILDIIEHNKCVETNFLARKYQDDDVIMNMLNNVFDFLCLTDNLKVLNQKRIEEIRKSVDVDNFELRCSKIVAEIDNLVWPGEYEPVN